MSRVLIAALSLSVFGGVSVSAQPLNINPFPVEKAGTLSSQEPVEAFARESEEEILQLERENEALEQQVREMEALKQRDADEQARLAAIEEQKVATLREQERLRGEALAVQAEQEVISLERKNIELAKELHTLNEQKRLEVELERENEALEQRLREAEEVKLAESAQEREQEAQALMQIRKEAQLEKHLAALAEQQAADERAHVAALLPVIPQEPVIERSFANLEFDGGDSVENEGSVSMVPMPLTAQDKVVFIDPAPIMPKSDVRYAAVNTETIQLHVLPLREAGSPVVAGAPNIVPVRMAFLNANTGESLEDVLRSWSDAEGFGFLWKVAQRFDVLKPVSVDGGYAGAVEALLSQYEDASVRPIGKLYTDPVTGFTTLSILSE